ncbi:phosphogluconate dehydrogenase C-terminal domain-containing protein [Herbaspirillum sp. RTI4]|uniref:phosphogluconate dehydrogenase C-terminal domain-containing protein n=1 Tax=Herbaspirillum sp. RTI4 TaxID=3048640 RepID=UPI002AB4CAFF|nr:phosphogluconate dehydrogenase C-terminal domain-containing protein [Herbaspirillum sp. RTI4]MDY7579458.1 phosphogluconate dehydrogenase C-terminal domain-containing protein [Herbaspirillum sp. RTI4]MEA9980372.1 phosphogluconate dehydrogenase C-terminal domain-containing protein [Herbaspirillum sp. RTI4]
MNEKIALFGAGGKMGVRLSKNLQKSDYRVAHVEVGAAGQQRLKDELGIECVSVDAALDNADVVILAVPDTLIGKIAAEIAPKLRAGTMLMTLDAAAPFAGHLPDRADLTYFVAHPCHPLIYNDETTEEARRDYFGGAAAKQSITSALMQGPESAFDLGEDVAKVIYAPILRSYRLTVDQMALLEPGLSETVCATLLAVMREAMDETVRRGVPKEAARDFLLGHMNILGAVIFNEIPGAFSDACNKAIQFGKPRLMRDDWIKVFDREEIAESIRRIT